MWHLLAGTVGSLRRLVHAAADWWRYWSGSMGQHYLLQLCARSWASRSSKIARWMGLEDPWNIATDMELDESIVVWHIATEMYLYWYKEEQAKEDPELLARAGVMGTAEALSNYMIFLLAARPHMLPPPASRNAYVHVCHNLSLRKSGTPEDLANLLRRSGNELNTRSNTEVQR